jgi:hypothetical protein
MVSSKLDGAVTDRTAEQWFTLEEAAVVSRRSTNALRQLRVKGRGPKFRKVDGRLVVSATELRRWLGGESTAS